ncbi:hypothetical protein LZP85_09695 [Priestia flexa]|uniref:HEAT repeat domain-containing protein n=1 Tax=Priestia flexa TaxID=86664 RepID=A0A1N6Z9Q6_9BACI|nr:MULTISPECIES: hypothetical protein [Bacillaceae]KZB90976.1 hypothetical protein A2U94_13205 [Bacillus sp. VT 712]MBN8252163.1 hypothetical protein [Priestia flexa]MBN8435108.1 hypothetical protein [Priestia flexa]MBY6087333.1 hypothetical protein [Priestia flexa]MCA0967390.1 hypothetical protein [Priestia flexa]
MNESMSSHFKNLEAADKALQYEAFQEILNATSEPVDWAYEVWEELMRWLGDADNHKRARGAQILAGLAKSDQEKRILTDFGSLWKVTKDEKFVTARHALQAIWKVGLAGDGQKELVLKHLVDRFHTCEGEKNATLIRFDIIQGLRNLYDETNDEKLKQQALKLVEIETDAKYQKKYLKVWK